jgi:hypothetical protein
MRVLVLAYSLSRGVSIAWETAVWPASESFAMGMAELPKVIPAPYVN